MDVWLSRIILVTLGVVLLVGIGGTIYLDSIGKTPPPLLATVVGTALGALTGYLMPFGKPSPENRSGNQQRSQPTD